MPRFELPRINKFPNLSLDEIFEFKSIDDVYIDYILLTLIQRANQINGHIFINFNDTIKTITR